MIIIGEHIRQDEEEFRLEVHPDNLASATFIAVVENSSQEGLLVTRRLGDILCLHDDTEVLANWHGQRRTDTFRTTVGHLRKLAEEFGRE